jgi:hypothetical protein
VLILFLLFLFLFLFFFFAINKFKHSYFRFRCYMPSELFSLSLSVDSSESVLFYHLFISAAFGSGFMNIKQSARTLCGYCTCVMVFSHTRRFSDNACIHYCRMLCCTVVPTRNAQQPSTHGATTLRNNIELLTTIIRNMHTITFPARVGYGWRGPPDRTQTK